MSIRRELAKIILQLYQAPIFKLIGLRLHVITEKTNKNTTTYDRFHHLEI